MRGAMHVIALRMQCFEEGVTNSSSCAHGHRARACFLANLQIRWV